MERNNPDMIIQAIRGGGTGCMCNPSIWGEKIVKIPLNYSRNGLCTTLHPKILAPRNKPIKFSHQSTKIRLIVADFIESF